MDVKTQKVYEQGCDVNIGPKIKETTTAIKQNTKSYTYVVILKWFV